MIAAKSLNLKWIKEVSKAHQKADPVLVEKVIRALLLLEVLVESQVDFVFKGGTALMLLLNSSKRLSIDIDITMPHAISDLQTKLESIAAKKGFFKMVGNERKSRSEINKIHFKFYYKPVYFGGRTEDNVLLDILFEKNQYQSINPIPIKSQFALQEGEVLKVLTPSFEDLLGDKLTAFAPETTGIPYLKNGQSQTLGIVKQLYDIGNLFDKIEDLKIVHTSFNSFAMTELSYRHLPPKPQLVIDDIFQTALTISTRGKEGKANFQALQDGISKIKAYIFSENYHIEKAIVHASKAAYIAKLIEHKNLLLTILVLL